MCLLDLAVGNPACPTEFFPENPPYSESPKQNPITSPFLPSPY
jgi:hypothetical protein